MISEGEFSMVLQNIHQKLQETRNELLEILEVLSEDQLNKQKDASSWSVRQISQHLSKTDELYAYAIRKGLKSDEDSSVVEKSFAILIDRKNKIEAPDIAKPTNEHIAYDEVIEKLNHSRQKINELLLTIDDPSLLSRKAFVHPVFKEMLLIDWFRSLYLHEQRHIKQIKEIINGED